MLSTSHTILSSQQVCDVSFDLDDVSCDGLTDEVSQLRYLFIAWDVLHHDMLDTVNFDTCWTEWQQALFVHAEIGQEFLRMEGASYLTRHIFLIFTVIQIPCTIKK